MEAHHMSYPWTYLEVKGQHNQANYGVTDNATYWDRREFLWRKGESISIK